jgi:hypothetical protein
MKQQANLRIEAEVWQAYGVLCGRDRLRPHVPVEEFLRVVVDNGSALNVLNMMRGLRKTGVEGFEAYARVLLDWYEHGKYFFVVSGNERASVEGLLLNLLKNVGDPGLRGRIEEALALQPHGRYVEKGGAGVGEIGKDAHEVPRDLEDEGPEDLRARGASVSEIQRKIDELKRAREHAKSAKGS